MTGHLVTSVQCNILKNNCSPPVIWYLLRGYLMVAQNQGSGPKGLRFQLRKFSEGRGEVDEQNLLQVWLMHYVKGREFEIWVICGSQVPLNAQVRGSPMPTPGGFMLGVSVRGGTAGSLLKSSGALRPPPIPAFQGSTEVRGKVPGQALPPAIGTWGDDCACCTCVSFSAKERLVIRVMWVTDTGTPFRTGPCPEYTARTF